MASDPNLNSGGACKNSMSAESGLDFTDLYQNEESFDLSNYMSAGNLELCSDDLFQNLFPPTSPVAPDLKKENIGDIDDELESWYNTATSNPPSNCASACSSAAPSPVPFNYYNTPPVTPQADKQRAVSPHHLQFDSLTNTMSSSRFAAMRNEESSNAFQIQQPGLSHQSVSMYSNSAVIQAQPLVKQELDASSKPQASTIMVKEEVPVAPLPLVVSHTSEQPNSPSKSLKRPHSAQNFDTPAKKGKYLVKGSMEYMQKRERNNVAVRRSRDKAKQKAAETQIKVEELSSENNRLHERVAELTHELNTLKNLLKSLHQVSG